jgi:autotransporter-associated beta strand protein
VVWYALKEKKMPRKSSLQLALALAITPLIPLITLPAHAADYFWRGQHGSTWNTLTSGTTNFATTLAGTTAHTQLPDGNDNIRFAATGATNFATTTLSQNFTVLSFSLQNTFASDVTVSGNTLTLGEILNNASGRTLTFNSTLTSPSSTLSVNSAESGSFIVVNSNIAGNFGLNKTGSGTLILNGTNNYTGSTGGEGGGGPSTSVSVGTLQIGSGGTTGSITGDVSMNVTTGLHFNRSDNITFAGNITRSGNLNLTYGSLTKLGAGILTLTGTNTYNGDTTISTGTLQIGDGGTTGSVASNITNNDALRFNRSNDLTYSGNISGSGTLTKLGTGTLTLSGSNSYTGGTTVSAGALQIGNGGVTGSVSGNITNNASLVFNRSDNLSFPGLISGNGTLTKLGSNTLTLTGNNTYSGLTTITAGTLQIGNGFTTGSITGNITNNAALIFNRQDGVIFSGNISGTGTLTKLGNGFVSLTGTNSFTGGTTISAGSLQIGAGGTTGSISGNITNNAALTFSRSDSITYAGDISGTGTLSISGLGSTTLTGSSTHSGGTTITAGSLQIGNGGTTGSISGNIVNNGSLRFNRSDNITFPGSISGSGSLTKLGAGTLIFTGSSTITGTTTISAGTFQLGSGGTTGSISANITNNANFAFNRSDNLSFPGLISGNGTLTKLGSNTLTLTGNNTYSGLTTISAGTLSIGGTAGFIPGNILNNAALSFSRSNDITYPGNISGTGTLTKLGNGFLSLTGTNSFTGGTTISAGTLNVGSANAIGSSGALTFTGGTLQYSASNATDYSSRIASSTSAISIDTNGRNVTFSSAIAATNTGGLTKLGLGTLTLSGNNAYTGTTTISAGTLQIGSGGTTGSISGNITNNAALIFNRSDSPTHAGNISGSGTLTKLGTGTLTLSGSNSYAGTTTVSAGVLTAASTAALPGFSTPGSISVASAATLAVQPNSPANQWSLTNIDTLRTSATFTPGSSLGIDTTNANFTYTSASTTTQAFVKLGSNTLSLTGNHSFTDTTVAEGTLSIGGSASGDGTIQGNITVNPGATLSFAQSNIVINSSNFIINGTMEMLNRDERFASLAGSGSITSTTSTARLAIDTNFGVSADFTGTYSGPGRLLLTGSNPTTIQTLSGDNTYSGGTIINAGILQIGNGGTSGSVAGDITNNAALRFNRSDDLTYAGIITGGTLTKLGTGTLSLTALNAPASSTVTAGTLSFGNGGTSGFVSGPITNNANVTFNRSNNFGYGGVISGSGSLTKLGGGIATLSGNNTYSGPTTISAGTLQIGSGGTTGSIAGPIANNAALIVNRASDLTLPGLITGTGTVTKLGAGILTLAPGQAAPYQMSALTITAGAINLTNNDLLLNYTGPSPIAQLISYLTSEQLLPNDSFNGLPTTLAIAESADLGLTNFNGIAIDDTTVIAKYTYVGDANLDGQVDALDYERIDLAIGNTGALGTAQGDLNYDGTVDALDYEQVDLNIGNGVGSPLDATGPATVFIPEPAAIAPFLAAGLVAARPRRSLPR